MHLNQSSPNKCVHKYVLFDNHILQVKDKATTKPKFSPKRPSSYDRKPKPEKADLNNNRFQILKTFGKKKNTASRVNSILPSPSKYSYGQRGVGGWVGGGSSRKPKRDSKQGYQHVLDGQDLSEEENKIDYSKLSEVFVQKKLKTKLILPGDRRWSD